jgi:antitoxin (DNA-binding transcriptional repressor) of toxin-antitoxin stability system
MLKLSIDEANSKLGRYLDKLEKGEKILLCRRNRPIAEIRSLHSPALHKPRPIGLAKGLFSVPESFFEELPDDMLRSFAGEAP